MYEVVNKGIRKYLHNSHRDDGGGQIMEDKLD